MLMQFRSELDHYPLCYWVGHRSCYHHWTQGVVCRAQEGQSTSHTINPRDFTPFQGAGDGAHLIWTKTKYEWIIRLAGGTTPPNYV